MEKILSEINNYFYKFYETGEYEIKNNTIVVKGDYLEGQYIRIEGSTLNDGIYKIKTVADKTLTIETQTLIDERFEGVISSLAIPKQLIKLLPKIEKYETENKISPITSESFGVYSYTLATDSNGKSIGWEQAFANELKLYRKMYDNKRGVKCVK